jgi:hypothetical protein
LVARLNALRGEAADGGRVNTVGPSYIGMGLARKKAKSVTHVSGTKYHLCLRPLKSRPAARLRLG